ncbi:MAG: hypothetical protein IJ265_01620 [Oscillospiraceae bacterium]|nr:hypothetical protein [Oscillospiraceae bacterium]MBQ8010237.1 hypothetical protein [Oscillospiraceae bacterium]
MEYNRMSTKDMLQYCDEALAWEEFGPVDIFFFESVKRILLGECPAIEQPEEPDELADVIAPVSAEELLSYEETKQNFSEYLSDDSFFDSSKEYVMTDGKAGN